MRDIAVYNSTDNCIHCLLKKIEFSLKWLRKKQPKHVAGNKNAKYIF